MFGTQGSNHGQFNCPTGIALNPSGTELYVCDTGNTRIQVLSTLDGSFLRKWGSLGRGPGQLQNFDSIVVSTDGSMVCVSDYGDEDDSLHRVQVFDPSGKVVRIIGGGVSGRSGQFDEPRGLAFTTYGTLLVCEWSGQCIQEVNMADGTTVKKWGKGGDRKGEFTFPHGIVVSDEGEIYVSEFDGQRVQVFV